MGFYEDTAAQRESAIGPVMMEVAFLQGNQSVGVENQLVDVGALLDRFKLDDLPSPDPDIIPYTLSSIIAGGDRFGYYENPETGAHGLGVLERVSELYAEPTDSDQNREAYSAYLAARRDAQAAGRADEDATRRAASRGLSAIAGEATNLAQEEATQALRMLREVEGLPVPATERASELTLLEQVPPEPGMRHGDAVLLDEAAPTAGARFVVANAYDPETGGSEEMRRFQTLGAAYEEVAARDPAAILPMGPDREEARWATARQVAAIMWELDPYGAMDEDLMSEEEVARHTQSQLRTDPEAVADRLDELAEETGVDVADLSERVRATGAVREWPQTELLHQAYLASLRLSQEGPDGRTENRYSDLMSELERRSGMDDQDARIAKLEKRVSELQEYKEQHTWVISGCEPEDVIAAYEQMGGSPDGITQKAAEEIARGVNEATAMDDQLIGDTLVCSIQGSVDAGEIAPLRPAGLDHLEAEKRAEAAPAIAGDATEHDER